MNDGGPAFPNLDDTEFDSGHVLTLMHKGMSLRDYLAAKAMQSMMIGCASMAPPYLLAEIAQSAYNAADAMIYCKNKNTEKSPN